MSSTPDDFLHSVADMLRYKVERYQIQDGTLTVWNHGNFVIYRATGENERLTTLLDSHGAIVQQLRFSTRPTERLLFVTIRGMLKAVQ